MLEETNEEKATRFRALFQKSELNRVDIRNGFTDELEEYEYAYYPVTDKKRSAADGVFLLRENGFESAYEVYFPFSGEPRLEMVYGRKNGVERADLNDVLMGTPDQYEILEQEQFALYILKDLQARCMIPQTECVPDEDPGEVKPHRYDGYTPVYVAKAAGFKP